MVYPIAKKKVVGATNISDDNYANIVKYVKVHENTDFYLWTLTTDDYLIAVNRFTIELYTTNSEHYCFICF